MAVPLLIDTDPGIDDAVAIALALASDKLDVRAIIGVGGNIGVDQTTRNICRLLAALGPSKSPLVGRGLNPEKKPIDRTLKVGADGMGDAGLADTSDAGAVPYEEAYRRAAGSNELEVLALGPLTNLAAILKNEPQIKKQIKRITISGGAVWAHAIEPEFNFERDPRAVMDVFGAGIPVTVVPLDVTAFVSLDDSHAGHLAASGTRAGQVLARILRYTLDRDLEPGLGKTYIKDAVAAGALLWPDLFLKTRMRLDVVLAGPEAGRCRPQLGGDPAQRVDLLTAVNAVDFIENLLEQLCDEAFVV